MKKNLLALVLTFIAFTASNAQETIEQPTKYTANNKGKIYIFWGGNRESYSKSDITFTGDNYNFTLYDVEAVDKPKGWHIDYINPARMTIPQTNLRIGYFLTNHYNISIGIDHMKYVMLQDKRVKYSGYYPNAGTFGENPSNGELNLTENFLTFEHTDGLNYINSEFCRVDDISSKIFKTWNSDKIQINLTEGFGAGLLYPKSNVKLFEKERHDYFHIAGYGINAKAGLNFTFFKYFFIQTELKGGYINMNDIRTSYDRNDRAKQHFWFVQSVIAVGGIFKL